MAFKNEVALVKDTMGTQWKGDCRAVLCWMREMGKQNLSGLSLSHRPRSTAFKGISNAQSPELLYLYFDYLFLFTKENSPKLFIKIKFTPTQHFMCGVGKCSHTVHFSLLHRRLPSSICLRVLWLTFWREAAWYYGREVDSIAWGWVLALIAAAYL